MNFDQSRFKSFKKLAFQNGSLDIKTAILLYQQIKSLIFGIIKITLRLF